MLACVRTAGHKYVVKVSRLSFEDAHLTGGEDRVYVMANRIGDDWPRGVEKCGASSRRPGTGDRIAQDRKSTRLNSSHEWISYAVFCLKKKKTRPQRLQETRDEAHGVG